MPRGADMVIPTVGNVAKDDSEVNSLSLVGERTNVPKSSDILPRVASPTSPVDDDPEARRSSRSGYFSNRLTNQLSDPDQQAPQFFDKPAVKWIMDRVCSSLKGVASGAKSLKKWRSGVDNPEGLQVFDHFIQGTTDLITFYDNKDEDLLVVIPNTCKTPKPCKTVILWRGLASAPPTGLKDPFSREPDVHVSNLLEDPLAHFRIELESVFIPYMLAGSKSAVTWPKVVQHDVIRQTQKFAGVLQHFEGLVRGTVVLPLPPDMPALKAEMTTTALDKKRRTIHIQETAIVEWTRHIRNVLNEESSTRLEILEERGIYPGATEEIKFWEKKHDKLKHIVRQLSAPKVRQVTTELSKVNSAYVASFDALMDDLDTALVEATDINMHLSTLRRPLEELELAEFHDIPGNLPAVFHTISLIWYTSGHYDVKRLKVLFRTMSNTVVSSVTKFLTATDLFGDTPNTVLQKLRASLAVASKFKDTYFSYRTQVNAQHGRPWALEETTVFSRVDKVIQRIRDLVEVFEIKSRFSRLEDFEPGGDRGNELQEVVKQVYQQFEKETLSWGNIVAGILDPSSTAFEESYTKFVTKVEEFDERIAMVVGKCFRERETYQSLKLLESVKDWQSAAVSVEKESRLQELLSVLRREVEVLFHRFESEKHLWDDVESGAAPLPNHLPWRTSLCVWVKSLLDRVKYQFKYLQELSRKVFKAPEGQAILDSARIFEETLVAWRESKLGAWKTHVTSLCLDRLDNTLFRRLGGSGLLIVNFDRHLAQALEDVWAIQGFGVELGHKVKSVFALRDDFRLTIARLEVVASQYNHIVETVVEVERPLIRKALDGIHSVLDEGLVDLTWRSPRINEFVEKLSKAVSTLHGNMIFLKGNISTVVKILKNWKNMHKVIHFSEEESWESRKKSILHELTELWQGEASQGLTDSERCARKWVRKWRDRVSTRLRSLDDVLKQYKRIRRLIEGGRSLLNVDANSPAWGSYLEHVNHLFTTLFVAAVKRSLEHLLKYLEVVRNLDTYGKPHEPTLTSEAPRAEGTLMSIKLLLKDCEAEFEPSISRDDYGSVQYRVYEWCNTVFEVGRQLPRLDDPSNHYYVLLFDHPDLNMLKDEILRLMLATIQKLEAVRMDFMKYAYLWQDDIDTYVDRFASGNLVQRAGDETGRVSPDPFEEAMAESQQEEDHDFDYGINEGAEKGGDKEESPATQKPSIAEFESQIVKYERLSEEIEHLPSDVNYGWITLDTSLIKAELVRLAHEWRARFLNYQKKRLISNLGRFKDFVSKTERGISISSLESVTKYSALVEVMRHLARFHTHCDQFDKVYEPSKNVVVLLKKHDIHLPVTVLQEVENAPVMWRDLKKKCFVVNELLSPRQMEEVAKIRLVEHNFEKRSEAFYRNTFQKKVPTSLSVPPRLAYKALSELHVMVLNLEYQLKDLREKQRLFQLMPSPGRAVRSCRTDLMLLKYLWDATAYAAYQMEAWNHVPCTHVNINEMNERVTRLVSMIKALDKRVRRWDVYHDIEDKAKNFLVSLPLIESLRTQAMRSIHWEELMAKTGVHFDFKELTIENLISLNLHKFPEEVSNIVGKATRQAEIEAQLEALNAVWATVSLVFDTQTGMDYPSFSVPPEVQETIEEHQLILQSLTQRRYISDYLTNVQQWQKTLATVEGVLATFVEVHKSWRYLQTIYIGSDDIKAQLPYHTQLFLEIDAQVKTLLRDASRAPAIVSLCCNEGREQSLSILQTQLSQCERALEGYMDQKRRTFPRFYFVSTPLLLEILSKTGKDPQQLMCHIPRVMQDVGSFGLDGFLAVSVNGRGGETFELANTVLCSGRVEHWLQSCEESVASTIFTLVEQALMSYSGRSRMQWIGQYITQVVLVTSHVHWTVDVSSTFHAMEEGNEAALKEQQRRYEEQLNDIVSYVNQPDLTAVMRKKVQNLVIQGVHQCEVIRDLIRKHADNKNAFSWQRQLRHRLNEKARGVVAEICDCHFVYGGEYHSEQVRLVITPLTERIYITLTQAIRLKLGGAPSGPPGTGKTETVKDLAKQLGRACYIFNCSEQMTFVTLGSVFKGLASGGVWGCFDEFNRIRPPVLSVVALQFRRLFEAQKQGQKEFFLGGDEVTLDGSCSIFVTMNKQYLSRGDLPTSIRTIFRPVTVTKPDTLLICENLLLASGFRNVKIMARKFDAVFKYSSELLSQQPHYYWGLRTVKSLLNVAANLRLAKPDVPEDAILVQALRDYNLPKIVAGDIDIFQSIIQDLFPGRALSSIKREEDFDRCMKKACSQNAYQPEEGLLAKCQQLHELLRLRHCVMIIGKPATGKSTCRTVLFDTYKLQGQKCVVQTINPKSVSSSQLFGCMVGKDWVDGLASGIIRSCASLPSSEHSCIVFDGDLDTHWIENMNSAMDENKVLTLASNDRIQLPLTMYLLFEITSLHHATPATVSRAGLLYISTADIGWLPYLQTWFDQKKMASTITPLLDKYVQRCVDWILREGKTSLPHTEFSLVRQLCAYIDLLLKKDTAATGSGLGNEREAEHWFVLACIWAFGGTLSPDSNHRARFDRWWRTEWKSLKFPEAGTVFDYYLSTESKKLEKWSETVRKSLQSMTTTTTTFVPTPSNIALMHYFERLVAAKQPVLLCGGDGTGKTALVLDRMRQLSESCAYHYITFTSCTTSSVLQSQFQQKLERKMGRRWGPIGSKSLIWVLDDVNAPAVDPYGTQSSIELIRQYFDYKMWYTPQRWQPIALSDVQVVGLINPSSGSYTVSQRFQRHFVNLQMPSVGRESCMCIYSKILSDALIARGFDKVSRVVEKLVLCTIDVHEAMRRDLPKTAAKFHYSVSLRQMSQLFGGVVAGLPGIAASSPASIGSAMTREAQSSLVKLWLHEVRRTYSDRLVEQKDAGVFQLILRRASEQHLPVEQNIEKYVTQRFLFCSVGPEAAQGERGALKQTDDSQGGGGKKSRGSQRQDYAPVEAVADIAKVISGYRGESHLTSDIVLFEDACEHVVRICRILQRPGGHAALIGSGGCGKRCLSVLAANMLGFTVVFSSEGSPTVTKAAGSALSQAGNAVATAGGGGGGAAVGAMGAGAAHAGAGGGGSGAPGAAQGGAAGREGNAPQAKFREEMKTLLLRTGVKGEHTVLLLSEHQLARDEALGDISAILSGADVVDFFSPEEREDTVRKVRPDVRQAMIVDTTENCWNYFMERSQRRLHLVLCMHPGESLRVRARRFSAILNCTVQDYFNPWDRDALLAVGEKRLQRQNILGVLGGVAGDDKPPSPKSAASVAKPDAGGGSRERGDGRQGVRNPARRANLQKEGKGRAGDDKHRDKKDVALKTEGQLMQESLVKTMVMMHAEAEAISVKFAAASGAPVHVTCRVFIEFINTYSDLLAHKLKLLDQRKGRLDDGLSQLRKAGADTVSLQDILEDKQHQVVDKKSQVDDLLQRLAQEKQIVATENAKAIAEEAKAAEIEKLVAAKSLEMEEDLAKAEPLVLSANRALDTLTKMNMVELKAFKSPPPEVQSVMSCVIILLSPPQLARDKSWAAAQKLMQRVDVFLQSLRNYKKEHIPETHIAQLRPYLSSTDFTGEIVGQKSQAAAGLCEWVRNVVKYYELYCYVQPKRESVQEGRLRLEEAGLRVSKIKAHVEKVQAKFAELESAVSDAQAERDAVLQHAVDMEARLELSCRLVDALQSEQSRWTEGAAHLTETRKTLVGDVLLGAALICYAGPLDFTHRARVQSMWNAALTGSRLPFTEAGLNPVNTLATPALLAEWSNQGLPSDTVSIQNACICAHSRRPVLLLDPQLQGHGWLKRIAESDGTDPDAEEQEEAPTKRRVRVQLRAPDVEKQRSIKGVVIARQGGGLKQALAQAVSQGETLVVDRVASEVSPLIATAMRRPLKGGMMALEEREVVCHPDFRLILHIKQPQARLRSELQAVLCVINFAIPEQGLEEQLLGLVVAKHEAALEAKRARILLNTNKNRIKLTELEDGLIRRIAEAGDDLVNPGLVDTLENMKRAAASLAKEITAAQETGVQVAAAREKFRPVARRGSLIFCILNSMEKLEWLYQYSLKAFSALFVRSIDGNLNAVEEGAEAGASENRGIQMLVSEMTMSITRHVKRGVLQPHRRVFELLLCLVVMKDAQMLPVEEQEFLMSWATKPERPTAPPASWLSQSQWHSLCTLAQCPRFTDLHVDVEKRLKRWKDWATSEKPEEERLPGDARYLGAFEKMLIVKVLRPDRFGVAADGFCQELLGEAFVHSPGASLMELVRDASSSNPVLFILTPGSDPLKDIENLAHKMGLSEVNGSLRILAMGEGQEESAIEGLRTYTASGGWIVLANIHLMGSWMSVIEDLFEDVLGQCHKDFRVFLTAEPCVPESLRIPTGLVQNSIKCLSNESSLSVQACMQKAWSCFTGEQLESSLKCTEQKKLLFALSYFHAAAVCRKRFGEHGWSKPYAFSTSDLLVTSQILSNSLDPNTSVIPWEDLRYIMGDITYGGHVTDEWDHRTLWALLETTLNDSFLQTGKLAPGLTCPQSGGYQQYALFLEHSFPPESPALLHMHPNAEMWSLTQNAKEIISSLSMLWTDRSDAADEEGRQEATLQADVSEEPGQGQGQGAPAAQNSMKAAVARQLTEELRKSHAKEHIVRERVEDILAKLPAQFKVLDLPRATPVGVFVTQELQRFNSLLTHMSSSLQDCLLGLRGSRTVSEQLDEILHDILHDRVPTGFRQRAYPSKRGLASWYADLLQRYAHLDSWAQHACLPVCVWIAGLFSPQAFLAVILQISARKGGVSMDELKISTDVVKKTKEDLTTVPREGAYIHGLCLEGAGWNSVAGQLEDPSLSVLHPMLPILYVHAVPAAQLLAPNDCPCPVYRTTERGDTYVFTANLKAPDANTNLWILRGICAVLSPEQ